MQSMLPAKPRNLDPLAIELLERRRPLAGILDTGERDRAANVRAWFRDSFLPFAPP